MKRTSLFLFLFLALAFSAVSQTVPKGIKYQAAARDLKGKILANQPVSLRISLTDEAGRAIFYSETHLVKTSPLGLFDLTVGGGNVLEGIFSEIPWATEEVWLEVALDESGGNHFSVLHSSRLLSVPYAMHAGSASDLVFSENSERSCAHGVPANVWSLKGNCESDPSEDKLGTTDCADLVIVTDNEERLRITCGGDLNIGGNVSIGSDLDISNTLSVGNDISAGDDLSVGDDASVGGDLDVTQTASVGTDLSVGNDATIGNSTTVGNDLDVADDASIGGDLDVTQNANVGTDLSVGNDATIGNSTTVGNDLDVADDATIGGDLDVSQTASVGTDLNVGNDLDVANDAIVGSDLTVTSNTTTNDLTVNNSATVSNDLNVSDDVNIGGDIQVTGGSTFTGGISAGATISGVDLNISNSATIGNDLSVGDDATIGSDLTVTANTTTNNLTVNNSATVSNDLSVGSDLTVTANTTTNNLTVNNNATVSNDLTVSDDASVGGDLSVTNAASVGTSLIVGTSTNTNSLAVTTNATVGGNVSVTGSVSSGSLTTTGSATVGTNLDVNGNLNVDGTSTFNGEINVDNLQADNMEVVAACGGSEGNFADYPFRVQGASQGIAIKVCGSRNNSNNFISFWDDTEMHGRIEGQTSDEYGASSESIWLNTVGALELALTIAEGIATGIQLDLAEVVVMAIEGAAGGAIWAATAIETALAAGVAYESDNGDYAEWLERANPTDDFLYGEIVGVRGGKISRNTAGADHLMVISKAPIVLGNMPPANREADFEKVAFMGQVPVNVVGKAQVGDYILPSGNHDGFGIAVRPADMKLEDYARIVGVAWEASSNSVMNQLNVAVGINANDLAGRVSQQQKEIEGLKAQMNLVMAYLKGQSKDLSLPENQVASVAPAFTAPVPAASPAAMQQFSDQWLEQNRSIFEERMKQAKAQFAAQGIDFEKMPAEARAIINDPVQAMKDMQSGKFNQTLLENMHKRRAERQQSK